jgi:hypothetical protein
VADLRAELLAMEDCPHLERARLDLERALRTGIIEVPVQLILVATQEEAEFLDFPGSPTIRINGEDVVPVPDHPIALACRVYRDAEGRALGSPPYEAISAAVQAHRRARLQAFQREEAGKVAEFAREADAAEFSNDDPSRGGDAGATGGNSAEAHR